MITAHTGWSRPRYREDPDRALFELSIFLVAFSAWVLAIVFDSGIGLIQGSLACGVVVVYVVSQLTKYRDVHRRWGFRFDGLGTGILTLSLMVFIAVIPVYQTGARLEQAGAIPELIVSPWVYLLWCVAQGFIFLSFCGNHLRSVLENDLAAAAGVGALFGLAHLPFPGFALLMTATGALAGWVFLRYRNILPIIGAHWMLGLALLMH